MRMSAYDTWKTTPPAGPTEDGPECRDCYDLGHACEEHCRHRGLVLRSASGPYCGECGADFVDPDPDREYERRVGK